MALSFSTNFKGCEAAVYLWLLCICIFFPHTNSSKMKPNKFDRIDATKTPKHPAVSLSQTMRRFESEYSLVFYLNFAFFGTAVGIT